MPVVRGRDVTGPYFQWGAHGRKYRYVAGDTTGREEAKAKAKTQGTAAYANGYRGSFRRAGYITVSGTAAPRG